MLNLNRQYIDLRPVRRGIIEDYPLTWNFYYNRTTTLTGTGTQLVRENDNFGDLFIHPVYEFNY